MSWTERDGRIVNGAPVSAVSLTGPGPADVEAAAERIASYVERTAVRRLPIAEAVVLGKLECLQRTGAFKVRGAANRILQLDGGSRGVVTASSGNHGRAVAHVAREVGLRAVICLPSSSTR